MKKLFILSIIGLNLFGQGTTDPTQRLGPSSSIMPRVFFGSAPNNVAGNKMGDFYITPTALYVCTALVGTAAPACSTVSAGQWQLSGTGFSQNLPDLTITLSHSGNFTQSQSGATYTITANNIGVAPTVGLVTVIAVPPVGISITALSGTGWTCDVPSRTCTRSDVLNASSSYPNISEVTTISSIAPTSLTNVVTIAGGGENGTSNDSAADPTTINPSANPDLNVLLSHTGNFTQSQTGATYSIVVTNVGGASTSGTVTITVTPPTGITATAMVGTGWSCTFGTGICTRANALAPTVSYPTVTYTVNVASDAPPSVTNSVTVTGGGDTNTSNNVSSDPTTITGSGIPVSDAFPGSTLNGRWTVLNPAGGTVTVSGGAAHLAVPGGANHDPTDSGMDQTLRIAQTIGNVNFQATVQFNSIPNTLLQFEGFLVKQDTNLNFMRFQIASDGTALHCNANVVLAGVSTGPIDTIITGATTSVWLRITRVGDLWTEFYSLDGVGFNSCGSATQSFTINEFDIWAGNFAFDPTMAPAFTANAANFVGATAGGGGSGATCTTSVTGSTSTAAIQTAINASTAGDTFCFSASNNLSTFLTLKAGITYTAPGALGTVVLHVAATPAIKMQGTGTVVSNLVLDGGGIEITGTTNSQITGNIIRNILQAGNGPAGIYQDPINNSFWTGSVDHNTFLNIYGPGELGCTGAFPPGGGQPCDYYHNGIFFFLYNNLTITQNVFDTISGDAIQLQQTISCGDIFGTGPSVAQPNLTVSFNQIRFNHRIPMEFQMCHSTNTQITKNLITGTFQPNAWDIFFSFAPGRGQGVTGTVVSGNYIDAASNTGPGNPNGLCYELGGDQTSFDGNFCTSKINSLGFGIVNIFLSVFGTGEQFTNNQFCGPGITFAQYDTSQCNPNGTGCVPYTSVNNKYTTDCTGFPAQTIF